MDSRYLVGLLAGGALFFSACNNRQAAVQYQPGGDDVFGPVITQLACNLFATPAALTVSANSEGQFEPVTIRLQISATKSARIQSLSETTDKSPTIDEPSFGSRLSHQVDVEIRSLGTHEFRASLSDGESSASCETSVNVVAAEVPPQPALSLFSENYPLGASNIIDEVPHGGAMILSWLGTHVTSCKVYKNASFTPMPISNSSSAFFSTGALTSDAVYDVRCDGESTLVRGLFTIRVKPLPQANLVAQWPEMPEPLPASGGSVNLTWTAPGALGCDLFQGTTRLNTAGPLPATSASPFTVNLLQTTTFSLTCGDALPNFDTSSVTIPVKDPEPVITLNVSSASVPYQGSATITWEAQNVASCDLDAADLSGGNSRGLGSGLSGSVSENSMTSSVRYTLSCNGGNITKSKTITVEPPLDHILFVSSITLRGNMSNSRGTGTGLAKADSICKALAVEASLRPEADWKAILSDGSQSARDRISLNAKVVTPTGSVIAEEGRLWSGAIQRTASVTEKGGSTVDEDNVWTGTNEGGTTHSDNCRNWTSADDDDDGLVGSTDDTDRDWLRDDDEDCDKSKRIYCISQ